ncbi:unnamed protein product [Phytophthora lilii]|uniref:Unnamed protein product n=1 Tax=Phytophthora lilii TaxID=2077276 RepID=A0A9W6XC23_9STRA|nr:unnamed protein product [Phytophthora lilii]
MYKELSVSDAIPVARLRKAAKTGSLSLTKADLAGSGATLHLHPESYATVMKAKRSGKGARVVLTKHEIEYPMTQLNGSGMHGGSIWKKIWNGLKAAWKPVIKPALSAAADGLASMGSAYVASTGRDPALVGVARGALKKFTVIGVAAEAKPAPSTMIGNIYRIQHIQSNLVYVGSTMNSIKYRWQQHKCLYKAWKDGKTKNAGCIIFKYFDEFGVAEFKCFLVKSYEVIDRDHSKAYETLWIKKLKGCN